MDALVVLATNGLQIGLVLIVQWFGFAGPVSDGSSPLLSLSLLLLLNLLCRLLPQQVLMNGNMDESWSCNCCHSVL